MFADLSLRSVDLCFSQGQCWVQLFSSHWKTTAGSLWAGASRWATCKQSYTILFRFILLVFGLISQLGINITPSWLVKEQHWWQSGMWIRQFATEQTKVSWLPEKRTLLWGFNMKTAVHTICCEPWPSWTKLYFSAGERKCFTTSLSSIKVWMNMKLRWFTIIIVENANISVIFSININI